MLDQQELQNLQHIEDLNQRGGRMLSVVDLIQAETLSVEAAAHLMTLVSHGASFLTGAVPGGAGKTTVMAALLGFLSPGAKIIPVIGGDVPPPSDNAERTWYLAHEIGAGHYFGYIWGRAVNDFFSVPRWGAHFVSCLHADTPEQMMGIITKRENGVPARALDRLGFVAFMSVFGRFGRARRLVAEISEPAEDVSASFSFETVFSRDGSDDGALRQVAPSGTLIRIAQETGLGADILISREKAGAEFLRQLIRSDRRRIEDVREAILAFYESAAWFE